LPNLPDPPVAPSIILRGVYPIIDTVCCARFNVKPESLAQAIARAGLSIAQFRHKGLFTREVFGQAEAVGRILRAANVRYIVNDRADVALILRADGVHLGQDDLPPAAVRKMLQPMLGSGVIIGYSTHNRRQLLAGDQEPVDYLAIGPMFPTRSKDKPDPVVGAAALAELRRLTAKPLVAIGGITRANAGGVLAGGADAVAVISDLLDKNCDGSLLDARLKEWLTITDRYQARSDR